MFKVTLTFNFTVNNAGFSVKFKGIILLFVTVFHMNPDLMYYFCRYNTFKPLKWCQILSINTYGVQEQKGSLFLSNCTRYYAIVSVVKTVIRKEPYVYSDTL